jgi:hypothetical protein
MATSLLQRRRPRRDLHLLTWLALAILLYAIAFAQFMAVEAIAVNNFEVSLSYPPLGYGWPLSYVHAEAFRYRIAAPRAVLNSSSPNSWVSDRPIFWTWSRPWPWEWEGSTIKHTALCIDIAVWIAMITSSVVLSEMRWRRSSGRWQISLRGVLGVLTATAIVFPIVERSVQKEWLNLKAQIISFAYIKAPIFDSLFSEEPFWKWSFIEWRLNVALVAIILCIGLTCSFYGAGMLIVRLLRRVPPLISARLAKKQVALIPDAAG